MTKVIQNDCPMKGRMSQCSEGNCHHNIKLNQLKSIGEVKPNTLIQDDCLNALWSIADKSVDMIFADLPYG